MKNKIIASLISLALLTLVSCSGEKIIQDFEGNTFGHWRVEGDAFGSAPAKRALPHQQEISGFVGKGFANSFHGGDNSRGMLISPEFKIDADYINFLIGGGIRPEIYISLEVEGQVVFTTHPVVESEVLHWMSWDVKEHKNKKAVIKIVDNQLGSWGHILIDQIEMNNKNKSDIMTGYKQKYQVNKKYLLIPIEDNAAITKVSVQKDGKAISPSLEIRIAQTKVDYWVPLNVDKYKGQEITLLFDYVKKSDIGFSQINQSDTFDFDYNEKYRPDYHFSPCYGWTNDPNGMVYYNGEYHLYYQHNPYGSLWGNMHWGHAVTKDLIKWEHLPVAIAPDSLGAIFSGSAVIDKDNTAGFGKKTLVAIYTSAGQIQTQSIAYSIDNGRTFAKYENNPVLLDPHYIDFRDPKVFWHKQSQQWIMSLATTQTITFYGSKNLKDWSRLSEFGEGIGNHGGVWECPDLFPLIYKGQTKWVLFVSINPGGPNGGSATQYFIGTFDGKTFTPDNLPYPLWIDYGRDNYAGVTWNDAPQNRRIFIGWMSNWDYANEVPTINFHNAMTVPRELTLAHNGKHIVIASQPVPEISKMRTEAKAVNNTKVETVFSIDQLLANNTGAFDIEMTIKTSSTKKFNIYLTNKKTESLKFVFDLETDTLSVDRSESGLINFSNNFAPAEIKSPLAKKETYKIRLLVDKASTELFVNDGELVQTNLIFPSEPYNTINFETIGGVIEIKDMKVYKLKQ